MPRKKRDIKRDYRRAGFSERPGKGDHTIFYHPLVRYPIVVDGSDGLDAEKYDVKRARAELEEAKKRQQP